MEGDTGGTESYKLQFITSCRLSMQKEIKSDTIQRHKSKHMNPSGTTVQNITHT